MNKSLFQRPRPLSRYILGPILCLIAIYLTFLPVEPWCMAYLKKLGTLLFEMLLIAPVLLWCMRCMIWTSIEAPKIDSTTSANSPALPWAMAFFLHYPARSIAESILGRPSGNLVVGMLGIAFVCAVAYGYRWLSERAAKEAWQGQQIDA